MSKKEKEQKEPQQKQGGKRAAFRATARARRKAHYANQFSVTEKNQRRKLARHVRSNPHDIEARKIYEKRMGNLADVKLTAKGKKLVRREKSRAKAAA